MSLDGDANLITDDVKLISLPDESARTAVGAATNATPGEPVCELSQLPKSDWGGSTCVGSKAGATSRVRPRHRTARARFGSRRWSSQLQAAEWSWHVRDAARLRMMVRIQVRREPE